MSVAIHPMLQLEKDKHVQTPLATLYICVCVQASSLDTVFVLIASVLYII